MVQSAAKAIHHRSGKDFLGRPIICDWAINKNTYVKNLAEHEAKLDEVKEEPIEIKEENDDDVQVTEVKTDKSDSGESGSESDEKDSDDEASDSDESDDSDDESEDEVEETIEPEVKRPRVISNDVTEGKTVFIKNVPFTATNEDINECLSQFGPLFYALVCVDPITEHSKGTAFVKFKVIIN